MGENEYLSSGCILSSCLYFSANRFGRLLTKLAEDEFKITGLSPTYAFAVTVINTKEVIASKELADYLYMAPCTITRFVDKLVIKGYAERKIEGKNSYVCSTEKGKELQTLIDTAWANLHSAYSEKIGTDEAKDLTLKLSEIAEKLE